METPDPKDARIIELEGKLQACQQANMDVLRDSDQAFERVKELDKYAGVLIESNRMLAEERDSYASRLDSVMTAFIKQQTDQDRLKEIERLLFPNVVETPYPIVTARISDASGERTETVYSDGTKSVSE